MSEKIVLGQGNRSIYKDQSAEIKGYSEVKVTQVITRNRLSRVEVRTRVSLPRKWGVQGQVRSQTMIGNRNTLHTAPSTYSSGIRCLSIA